MSIEAYHDEDHSRLSRRRLLHWLGIGSALALTGCGGTSSGEAADINVVPAPTPLPTPTPVPSTAPSPTPSPTHSPTPTPTASPAGTFRRGFNLSSMEGAPDALPGHLGGEVFVTPDNHFSYYAGVGMDHIRLQGVWERLQPRLYGSLGEQLLDHYDDPNNPLRNPVNLVKHYLDLAQKNGLRVILDLAHNYGRRYIGYNGSWGSKTGVELGSAQLPVDAFADYCVKLVQTFGSHPAVMGIELMNEPHDLAIGAQGWQKACQTVINAIRKVNSSILIFVDGYQWASAQSWANNNPTIHQLSDPAGKIMFSAHQYFDANSSGTYGGGGESAPGNANIGVDRVTPFINWLQQHGLTDHGHIGEFGAPNRTEWQPIVRNFVEAVAKAGLPMTAHQDIAYPNDPYQMNLFPQINASGQITGAENLVVQAMASA
ncbi:MAG: glycoside hydrolase family 5 protein [Sphingomonas sp.]